MSIAQQLRELVLNFDTKSTISRYDRIHALLNEVELIENSHNAARALETEDSRVGKLIRKIQNHSEFAGDIRIWSNGVSCKAKGTAKEKDAYTQDAPHLLALLGYLDINAQERKLRAEKKRIFRVRYADGSMSGNTYDSLDEAMSKVNFTPMAVIYEEKKEFFDNV